MLKFIVLAQVLIAILYLGKWGLFVTLGLSIALVIIYLWITKNSLKKNYSKLKWEEMPWLYDAVAKMSYRAGISMPNIYILDDYIPNAYSFRNSLVLSLGLFEVLSENEILGVAAHEIGHIKNGDTILFPMVAYGRYLMLFLVAVTSLFSHHKFAIFVSLILYVLYEIERVNFFKKREFRADETALYLLDRPFNLKDALEELKYYEDLRITVKESALPGIEPNIERKQKKSFMTTHPSYDERILRILVEIEAVELLDNLK